MKYSSHFLLPILSLVLVQPMTSVCAEESASSSCDISCPSGQKVVSFTDGDNVACVCAAETEMVPTELDPDIATLEGHEDEGQRE
jgi:hypothetical protein